MKKKMAFLLASVALLLLAACVPGQGNGLPGDNRPADDLNVREQLIALGFSESQLDWMEAEGRNLERTLNEQRFREYEDRIYTGEPIGPSGESILPEYYGGFYYNDEGIMTVIVLEEAFSHAASASAIAEMQELGIIVRTAVFSHQELTDAMDALNQVTLRIFQVSGVRLIYLDTIGNRITVPLDPYTDEQKSLIMDLLLEASVDPAMIAFREVVTQEMLDPRTASIITASGSSGNQIVLVGDVTVSRTGIAFSLENRTDLEFNYGEPWDLACYLDGRWTPVPHLPGRGSGWISREHSLQSGEIKQYRQEWDWFFGELPPGRYMFIRGGWLGDWSPDQDDVYALVEFDITEDSPVNLPPQSN